MKPIILYNQKWIRILPMKNNKAIMIWPLILFAGENLSIWLNEKDKRISFRPSITIDQNKEFAKLQQRILRHETCHFQQANKLIIPYLFYAVNAIIMIALTIYYRSFKKAYINNPYEKEAREAENDPISN